MKLNVLERLVTLNPQRPILPEEGRIDMLRIRANLIEKIGLTAEEWLKYKVRPSDDGEGLVWDQDLPQDFEIALTPAEIVLMGESLKKLEAAEPPKLRAEHVSLYNKFVENGRK